MKPAIRRERKRLLRVASAFALFTAVVLRGVQPAGAALPSGLGDLDNDGRLTVLDLVLLISHLNSQSLLPSTLHRFADADQNGVLNQADVDKLADAILGVVALPPPTLVPIVTAPPDSTSRTNAVLTGRVYPYTPIRIDGGVAPVTVTADSNGNFTASVTLVSNRVNRIYVSGIDELGVPSAPQSFVIIQDSQPPSLYIDFPADGSELTSSNIVVAGRVGDMLSGFMGLNTWVTNVTFATSNPPVSPPAGGPAAVDVGIGQNGTFARGDMPLALGTNVIVAIASDVHGNTVSKQITLLRVPLAGPRMAALSGDRQTTNVHRPLINPLLVQVTHPDGTPFVNKVVTFEVIRSDGRLLADPESTEAGTIMLQLSTDDSGLARAWWTLGGDAGCGNNRVAVTSRDISGSIFFCASANPALPRQINIGSGNNQKVEAGSQASEPLRAWVSDSCNGIRNVPVTFTITQGGGRLLASAGDEGAQSLTIPSSRTGHAEVLLQLGPDAGQNVVEASFPGSLGQPATFIAYGVTRDPAKPTTFTGLILDNISQPIGGAWCRLFYPGTTLSTYSGDQGRFTFTNAFPGPSDLNILGSYASTVGTDAIPFGTFPALSYSVILIPNAENSLPRPVLLPRLNTNNAVRYYGTNDLVLTCQGIAGLKMTIKANSMRDPRGDAVTAENPWIVSLNQVHHDDVPMPIPDGAAPPFAWTLQPGGATFDPPIQIEYPNMSGLAAGSIAYFLSYNHDTERFEIVASSHVTQDGSRIVTDPGAGLSVAGWGCNCPPYAVTGDCDNCPRPFRRGCSYTYYVKIGNTCVPQTIPLPGQPCNDGNQCTRNDQCDARGVCRGERIVCGPNQLEWAVRNGVLAPAVFAESAAILLAIEQFAKDNTDSVRDSYFWDAVRHIWWQCVLTRGYGSEIAKSFGDAHEVNGCEERHPQDDQIMDLHNNVIGRRLGTEIMGRNCFEAAIDAAAGLLPGYNPILSPSKEASAGAVFPPCGGGASAPQNSRAEPLESTAPAHLSSSVGHIVIEPLFVWLLTNESVQVQVKLVTPDGQEHDKTPGGLGTIYSSSDWQNVSVSSNGLVSGKALSVEEVLVVVQEQGEILLGSFNVVVGVIDDLDGDGVPNIIEQALGTDRLNFADGDSDSDKDGLSNREEYILGTNPKDSDTDGDGRRDAEEVNEFV